MNKDRSGGTSKQQRSSDPTLPLDTVFYALASHRRRTVLSYLISRRYPVPLEELVDMVALQEAEVHVGDIPAEVYEEVAIDLHHTQLPKLAEWGVVDYDRNLKLVTAAETLRPLDEYLRLAEQHDRHSGQPYDRS